MANLTFLPLDLTGALRSSLRENEPHILMRVNGKTNRVCVLDHGAFYVNDALVVRDATGRRLDHLVDFTTTYLYAELSSLTAKEIMGMIVVTNTAVVSPLTVTYQPLGGGFSLSVKELKALMTALEEDKFTLKWEDIIGKPTAYVPKKHPHEWWQLWGMESTVTEIDRIANAWKIGTKAIEAETEAYGDAYVQKGRDAIDEYSRRVRAHISDLANPHETDKVKAGLSNINNWTMADANQVLDRGDNAHYLPIGGIYRILNTGPLPDLQAHIRDPNNPHGTTAADANTWTKAEIDQAFTGKYLWTDVAADSKLYAGRTMAQLRYDVTTNLDAADINSGGWTRFRMGTNGPPDGVPFVPEEWALCGDGVWRKWSVLVQPFNNNRTQYIALGIQGSTAAAQSAANVIAASGNYPLGTMAVYTVLNHPTPDVVYYTTYMLQRTAMNGNVNDWSGAGYQHTQ